MENEWNECTCSSTCRWSPSLLRCLQVQSGAENREKMIMGGGGAGRGEDYKAAFGKLAKWHALGIYRCRYFRQIHK